MRIVICGAGQVGFGIAERLAGENHDVSVIDRQADSVRLLTDKLDVRGHVGHGAHPDDLARAGADQADMLIAVTRDDEVNMVACQVAHSLFDVPVKIARLRAQSYREPRWQNLFSRDHMPIDVIISPEAEVGEAMMRRLAMPGVRDLEHFGGGAIAMMAIQCGPDSPVIDTPLRQLTALFPDLEATVVGLWRGDRMIAPRAADQLEAGDIAYVICATPHMQRTVTIFGRPTERARRIVIAGGGNVGLQLAQMLETNVPDARTRIIETATDNALFAADRLRNTVVLHGSALDEVMLREAGIGEADVLVATTQDDQVNILSAVLAKRMGCRSTLVLINNQSYRVLTGAIGIDDTINPRAITVSRILQYIRRGRIRSVYALQGGSAEVIEAEALETSPLVGHPLRSLRLPHGIRIGAIQRDRAVLKPRGDTVMRPGDRVVLLVLREALRQVEQMFRVSLEFF